MKDTVKERDDSLAGNRYAGYTVYDRAGEKIGEVGELFVEDDERTEYIVVKIDPLEPRSTVVPIDIARVNEQRRLVEVAASKEGVEDALTLADGNETSPAFEQRIQSFFDATNDEVLEVLPTNWVVPFLLVRLREGDCYGRELAQKVTCTGFGASHPRAVYRVLQQMEKDGTIAANDDGSEREPSRRRYSITELGDAYLEYLANTLMQYGEEIDLFFRLFDKQFARGLQLEHDELQSERETRKDAQTRY